MTSTENLTIYKASAGSGKTYTLALEFIKLLLGIKDKNNRHYLLNLDKYVGHRQPRRHRHILAITFTNKATAEMKDRIIDELRDLTVIPVPQDGTDCAPKDANYAPELCKVFGCSREELAVAAKSALTELLFDYSNFNVSTIDSFFQQILRTFAREVDRQGDYEIELDTNAAVNTGVMMMLDDLNYGQGAKMKSLERWISDYMMRLIQSKSKFNLFNRKSGVFAEMVKFISKSCDEEFQRFETAIVDYLSDPKRITRFRHQLANLCDKRLQECQRLVRNIMNAVENDNQPPTCLKEVMHRVLATIEAGRLPEYKDLTAASILNFLKWNEVKPSSLYSASGCRQTPAKTAGKKTRAEYPSDSVSATISECVRQMLEHIYFCMAAAKLPDACDKLEFMNFAREYIERFRIDNNIVLLADTNSLLQRIISDDDTPFVYERMGVELHHFLIDEFQDTSHMQWAILRPLVRQGLADLNDSLIIGDEKQAIYRFRSSDSSMLHSGVANDDFPEYARVRGSAPGENTNYRSAPGIVRFNNTLFSRLAAQLHIEGYENVAQDIPKYKTPKDAYIRVTIGKDKEYDPLTNMAEELIRQHNDGYRWGNMAILVRNNAEASTIVEFLLRNYPQISVLSEEALYLRNSPSIKIITGLLQILDRSNMSQTGQSQRARSDGDRLAMIARFNFYLSSGKGAEEALELALNDDENGVLADYVLQLQKANASSLTAMIETIVEKFIPPAQRKQEMAYISAFEDLAIDFGKRYTPSVHDFINWWEKSGNNAALPSVPELDAVNVMTIHKAKGLEWECVHIPMAHWEMFKYESRVWINPAVEGIDSDCTPPILPIDGSKMLAEPFSPYAEVVNECYREQTADTLNITYVAFTRAERELIVYSKGDGIGAYLAECLQQAANSNEASGLNIDLASGLVEDPELMVSEKLKCFIYGKPTKSDSGQTTNEANQPDDITRFELPAFNVCTRDDTREFVSMDDLFAAINDMDNDDNDDDRLIVDAIDPQADAEERHNMEEAAERGNFLHAVMARIDDREDLDRAFAEVLAASTPTPESAQDYLSDLREALALDDPRVKSWFDPDARIIKEQSFLLTNGKIKRPDRIIIHDDGSVDLVDFKFTSSPRPPHQDQLRTYCEMLRAMGYERVRGHLWYPLLGIIASEQIV